MTDGAVREKYHQPNTTDPIAQAAPYATLLTDGIWPSYIRSFICWT